MSQEKRKQPGTRTSHYTRVCQKVREAQTMTVTEKWNESTESRVSGSGSETYKIRVTRILIEVGLASQPNEPTVVAEP